MQVSRPPKPAQAVTALVALLSPSAVGLVLSVHLLSGHHNPAAAAESVGVEIALHGHAHVEGTPPHAHPLVGSVAAPLPGRILVPSAAFLADAPEALLGDPLGRRALFWDRPMDDPPPRRAAPAILRI